MSMLNRRKSKLMVDTTAEFEFSNFKAPRTDSDKPNIAGFLRENPTSALPVLTEGRFGYSLTRPTENQIYFHEIFDKCNQFDCGIEGWHTESGLGVFEAALSFDIISDMADKANLFKYISSYAIHETPS